MFKQLTEAWSHFRSGLITEPELAAVLDKLQVHGGFSKSGNFAGYDYVHQVWIRANQRGVFAD